MNSRIGLAGALLIGLASGACNDTTPAWDLSHDRVVAVRATPPAIVANDTSVLEALLSIDRVVAQGSPQAVSIAPNSGVTPQIAHAEDGWTIVAPDAQALAAARERAGLASDEPVTATLVMTFDLGGVPKQATKTVRFGVSAANPDVDLRVAGMITESATIGISEEVDLETSADESNLDDEVDWLTTIGDLTDIDDPVGHLTCEKPGEGTVVVVRRDGKGGVGWNTVHIEAR